VNSRFAMLAVAAAVAIVTLQGPGCQKMDEQLYESAEELLEHRKYKEAEKKLTFLVNQYPESPIAAKAYFKLGEMEYFFFKKPEAALDNFVHAARADKKGKTGLEAQKHIAEIYLNHMRNHELAILQYQRIIRDFKGMVEADEFHYMIAQAYYGKRDYKQAIIEYQNMLDMFPDSKLREDGMHSIATCYFVDGQLEEAMNQYLAFLIKYKSSKHDYDARMSLAMVYEGLDQPTKALNVYSYLAEKYPDHPMAGRKVDILAERMKDQK